MESEKQRKCSSCDNQPKYRCSECLLYLCEECSKHREIIPSLKDHPLYILDDNEESRKGEQKKCPIHCRNVMEFYCSTCKKSACKKCNVLCFQKKHDITDIHDITEITEMNFHRNAAELVKTAQSIKNNLKRTLDSVFSDLSDFQSHIKLCRTGIEVKEKILIKKVEKKSQKIILQLKDIYKEIKEDISFKLEDIDSKLIQLNNLNPIINTMNKPKEEDTVGSNRITINAIRNKFLEIDDDKFAFPKLMLPTNLEELINAKGIGKIKTVDNMYKVAQDGEAIIATKEDNFVVNISSPSESDAYPLAATLKNSSGEESPTVLKYQGNGEYKITGRCNVEGDWQMKITAGEAQIKGSPVKIKVVTLGLVHTIENISDYKEHDKRNKVADVVFDMMDGCILVSSRSEDILKFNRSGLNVAKIQVPENVKVNRMHQMDDGHIVYTDYLGQCVVLCDKEFKEIRSFGKGILQYPSGLTVNNETRVLYVADENANCVYKFSVDDGRLLGKIGSEGGEEGQMKKPQDVTLNKAGCVIVADFGHNRLKMFDVNDNLIRVVWQEICGPCGVTTDMDENIIVSNNHKLKLFDKNGIFIKRIDHEDDGLDIPCGLTVISNRPRTLAVANYVYNNVKIFNY